MANEMLADSTLAGQEGSLSYLAGCAALQQWGQAALGLFVLQRAEKPLSEADIQQRAEDLLEDHFQACLCLDLPLWHCNTAAVGPGFAGYLRLAESRAAPQQSWRPAASSGLASRPLPGTALDTHVLALRGCDLSESGQQVQACTASSSACALLTAGSPDRQA